MLVSGNFAKYQWSMLDDLHQASTDITTELIQALKMLESNRLSWSYSASNIPVIGVAAAVSSKGIQFAKIISTNLISALDDCRCAAGANKDESTPDTWLCPKDLHDLHDSHSVIFN